MRTIRNKAVAAVFKSYPSKMRPKLRVLRQIIFDAAAMTDGVGKLEETLRWGEPAYLTSESGSGSTVRIAWNKAAPAQYAMYFNCQTGLISTFRTLFPDDFRFEGSRAIVFDAEDLVPINALSFCVAIALTYHRDKHAKNGRDQG